MIRYQLFINGKFVDSSSGKKFNVIDMPPKLIQSKVETMYL